MRLVALLAVSVLATVASAGGKKGGSPPPPKQPANLVPYGNDWSCFHPKDEKASGVEPPRCERSEAACKTTRATLAAPATMSDCQTQATATVLTYYDPSRTAWRFLASPDDDGCLALRRGLLAAKSYERIAQCEEVGKRFPAPAKLQSAAITPGKTWWCLELPTPVPRGARPQCVRTVAQCEELIRRDGLPSTRCKEKPSALVLTFKDQSGWSYSASSTGVACNAYRDDLLAAAGEVSACTVIGAVERPKLDRKVLPKGSGWVCFAGADPAHPVGSCARTAKDCGAQYELDRYVLGNSEGCKPQRAAWARFSGGQLAAFPTAALCEAHVEAHPDGSRCESVN